MTSPLPATNRGFTLVELMIGLILTLFLAGGVVLVHLSGRSAFIDVQQLAHLQENVRFASDYLIRDIRNAGFRDETFLRSGHEQQIREAFATLLDSDGDGFEEILRVRYAGRGHCTEAFDEFRLVENEYFLNTQTGELSCRGRTVARDDPGATQISEQSWSDAVGLVRGFTGLAFQKICPDGTTTCPCDLVNHAAASCTGIRVAMQLQGMRTMDGADAFDDRSIELVAAFRNVILEQINTNTLESEGSS